MNMGTSFLLFGEKNVQFFLVGLIPTPIFFIVPGFGFPGINFEIFFLFFC